MNIQEIRQKYPQYSDMSDGDLASALHQKYYSDIPYADFSAKVGLAAPKPVSPRDAIGDAQARPEASVLGMNVSGETDSGFNPAAAIIGAGRLGDKLNQGYQQAKTAANFAIQRLVPGMNGGQDSLDALMAQKQSEAEKDRLFKKLETVHPGSTQIGQIAPILPLGPAAMLTAAATEYGSPEERALRVGATAAGNKLAQVAGKSVATKVDDLAAAKSTNAVKDESLAIAKDAGYVVTPSQAGGSTTGRVLEGLTGKEKAIQLGSVKNQPNTDMRIRKQFDLPEQAPISYDTMKSVRNEAFNEGYAPIRDLGVKGPKYLIKPDEEMKAAAKAITSTQDNASRAFGDLVTSDTKSITDGLLNAKPFTGSEAVDAIALLREKSSQAYRTDKALGKAYKDAAEAIEGQVERFLAKSGKDGVGMLKSFRDARTRMAQSFEVEKAIREGAGSVDARVLGKVYGKSPKRLTGELATIGRTANAFPETMGVPKAGWSDPVTALDTLGYGSASIFSGTPLPMAIPAARAAIRQGLLTGPGQRMFSSPNYDPGLLLRGERALLENDLAPQAGGLLGYYFANR